MRKMTVPLAFAATAALITVVVMSMASKAVSMYAQARPVSSYAEDRAEIEDLQAQYLFALRLSRSRSLCLDLSHRTEYSITAAAK